jgi:ribonuclease HI
MTITEIIIHTDGGARGNPGPAACAFIAIGGGNPLGKGSQFLGNTTNNVAEYRGVLLALEWLLKFKDFKPSVCTVSFYLDSELIVNQLKGVYKVKNETLKKINLEIEDIVKNNHLKISLFNVPRSQNKEADLLVNKKLDGQLTS